MMRAVNYTQFRNNMKSHLDRVTDDCETLTVTRKSNKNVVIISEEAYNNLLENIYLRSDRANYEWLLESRRQLENGKLQRHELIEVLDE